MARRVKPPNSSQREHENTDAHPHAYGISHETISAGYKSHLSLRVQSSSSPTQLDRP